MFDPCTLLGVLHQAFFRKREYAQTFRLVSASLEVVQVALVLGEITEGAEGQMKVI